MRISVCEFLRLQTQRNWYYLRPGTWANSDNSLYAFRYEDAPEEITIQRKSGKHFRTLEYFAGLPSNEVRRIANGDKRK